MFLSSVSALIALKCSYETYLTIFCMVYLVYRLIR